MCREDPTPTVMRQGGPNTHRYAAGRTSELLNVPGGYPQVILYPGGYPQVILYPGGYPACYTREATPHAIPGRLPRLLYPPGVPCSPHSMPPRVPSLLHSMPPSTLSPVYRQCTVCTTRPSTLSGCSYSPLPDVLSGDLSAFEETHLAGKRGETDLKPPFRPTITVARVYFPKRSVSSRPLEGRSKDGCGLWLPGTDLDLGNRLSRK